MRIKNLCISAFIFLCTVSPSWAQENISELLAESGKSPFEMNMEDLKARISVMQRLVDREMLALAALESEVDSKFKAIRSTGYDPEKFMAEFAELSARLPKALQEEINNGQQIDAKSWLEKSAEFRALNEFVDAAKDYVEPFVSALDSYNLRTMDAAMAIGILRVSEQALKVRENGTSPEILAKLHTAFLKMDERRQSYSDNKDQFGQPKGSYVFAPSNRFLGLLKTISIRMQKNLPGNPETIAKENSTFWNKLGTFFRRIPITFKLVYSAAKVRSALWNQKSATENVVPFTSAVMSTFRNLGDFLGIEVETTGLENIVRPYPPKSTLMGTVKNTFQTLAEVVGIREKDSELKYRGQVLGENDVLIINPTHRDSLMDFIALANTHQDHLAFFGAAGNFLPNQFEFPKGKVRDITELKRRIISLLNESDSFIVVGKGKDNLNPVDPIEKAIRIRQKGKIKVFVLFSEGMLPSELGAISPIQEKSFELVRRFRALGLNVILSGAAFKNNHDPFDLKLTGKDSKRLEAEIFPSIPDHLSEALATVGGNRALSLLYRFAAVSSMITNDSLLFGQVRATQLEGVIEKHMRLKTSASRVRSCRALLD